MVRKLDPGGVTEISRRVEDRRVTRIESLHPGGVADRIHKMGSTFASIHVHLVFATKERRELIRPEWRPRLHAYAGGVLRGLNVIPESIGGVADHVHVLAGIRPVSSVADVMRELKKQTNSWVRENFDPRFGWQEGYAAFSVGSNGIQAVKSYIEGQEEHHRKFSFKDELRALLEEAGISFEERYLD